MSKISPIISFKANESNNNFEGNKNSKYEFPLTYKQYKTNCIIADTVGAAFAGGVVFGFSKFLKSDNKTAGMIGLATAAAAFICSIFRGCNGNYEVKYLKNKQSFENPKISAVV